MQLEVWQLPPNSQLGGMAHGYVAIGSSANGVHTLVSTNCSLEMISNFILRQHNLNAKIVEFYYSLYIKSRLKTDDFFIHHKY